MNNGNVQYIKQPDELQHEHLLGMLIDQLNGMVYRFRFDKHWLMEFVSNGCFELSGYSPDELLNNAQITYDEITHSDDRERVQNEIVSAIKNNQQFDVEYRIHHRDGSIRWVWERGRGVFDYDIQENFIHGFIQDITQRHQNETALAEAEKRYRSIFENATEGIFQTTYNGNYLEVNMALARIYGYDSTTALMQDLKNISRQLYVDPYRRNEFIQLMQKNNKVINFESQVYKRDRSIIWISENAHAVYGTDGELLYYEGTVEDITDRRSYERKIAHQATHDVLTDLPNRLLLTDRLQQNIQNASRENVQIAILFIDLDHFKNVNDSLGHAAGDILIKEVAERLRKCMRYGDTVARIGGDEFVLILPSIHSRTEMMSHAVQRILDMIKQPCIIEEKEFYVSCSIGISIYPEDGKDAENLLKNADMAMYKAKQSGRNNFQFFTEELNRIVIESLELEHRLRQALIKDEFELYYQPKLSTTLNKVIGIEALVRWRTPDKGLISPLQFIPLAEETGLIEPLGAWVLDAACKQLKSWSEQGLTIMPVSVNISPRQFNQPDLLDNIKSILHKHALPAELLELEITENCMVHDERKFLQTLQEMKDLGLQLSIDDFGSGYCNMNYLKTMPVDYLKVDRTFITGIGIENDEKSRAIYRAIVAMAHNLDIQVISEGVETKEQYEFVNAINCDAIQGYFFSKPLTADDFARLLKT
jgi:diguanylate cyclase (GGDEF)-like protein/PAS domain S-box-containing protein